MEVGRNKMILARQGQHHTDERKEMQQRDTDIEVRRGPDGRARVIDRQMDRQRDAGRKT